MAFNILLGKRFSRKHQLRQINLLANKLSYFMFAFKSLRLLLTNQFSIALPFVFKDIEFSQSEVRKTNECPLIGWVTLHSLTLLEVKTKLHTHKLDSGKTFNY